MKIEMNAITRGLSRGRLLVSKHSPEILLGLGVVGIISATVMAVKATVEGFETVKIENKSRDNDLKLPELATYLTEEEFQKEVILTKAKNVLAWVKLYGPSASLMIGSLGCVVGSHGIMQKRARTVMAAYTLLAEGFKSYRNQVVDQLGEDEDRKFRFGIVDTETEEVNEKTGKKKKIKKKTRDPNGYSDYARIFDEYSLNWRNDNALNMYFLKSQQTYFNQLLKTQGHVFLNEVYDALGFPRTSEGTVVGWIYNGDGDGFIDFGLYEIESASFVNGYEAAVILDFNVDGLIHKLI